MKYGIIFGLLALLGVYIHPVHAENGRGMMDAVKDKVQRVNEELDGRSIASEGAVSKNKNVKISNATVNGISGTTFTISSNNKTIIVTTDSQTQFRRLFWGKSALSEITVNDKVNVWGTWTDDTHTKVTAKMIRDLSIQKLRGVFFGTVQSATSSGMMLSSQNRGAQTVTFTPSTRFINRTGGAITATTIKSGDTVRIRGVWDKTNNTITEVTEIKDFSLPPHTVVTPTP